MQFKVQPLEWTLCLRKCAHVQDRRRWRRYVSSKMSKDKIWRLRVIMRWQINAEIWRHSQMEIDKSVQPWKGHSVCYILLQYLHANGIPTVCFANLGQSRWENFRPTTSQPASHHTVTVATAAARKAISSRSSCCWCCCCYYCCSHFGGGDWWTSTHIIIANFNVVFFVSCYRRYS